MKHAFFIDHEIANLFDPPSVEERQQLEANLIADGGATNPLAVWEDKNILLQGHNRLELCEKHSLPYDVKWLKFKTREDAITWVINNQLGQRNLSEKGKAKARALRVEREAEARKDGKSIRDIASTSGVSPSQVTRDLASSGVPPGTPDASKVTGKDGKSYSATKEKLIPWLAQLRDAGKLSPRIIPDLNKLSKSMQEIVAAHMRTGKNPKEAIAAVQPGVEPPPAKAPKAKATANGAEAFTLTKFNEHLSRGIAELDKLCHEYELFDHFGHAYAREHSEIIEMLEKAGNHAKTWYAQLRKRK